MSIKNKLPVFCLILFCYFSKAQNNYTINGIIKTDKGVGIPYTHIISFDNVSQGTYSDINGYFYFSADKIPTTIQISNVGYETKNIKINSSVDDLEIVLNERTIILKDIIITDLKLKPKSIGSPKNPKGMFQFFSYNNTTEQVGLVVRNTNSKLYQNPKWLSVEVKIERPLFGMGVKPDGTHKIRLRIYKLESNDNEVSDILHQNIILTPKKGGWLKIDLENFDLTFPQEGFIVAIEWLPFENFRDSKATNPSERFINLEIKGHEIQQEQKPFYALWQYNHVHLQKDSSYRKSMHRWEQEHIPCIRLNFIEMDNTTR